MAIAKVPGEIYIKTQLNKIIQASSNAKELVKKILIFSRQSQQECKVLPLQSLLKESLKVMDTSLPSSIKIQTNLTSDCYMVFVDPAEIQQIVMNLFSNSIWAITGKGTIEIKLKKVYLSANKFSIDYGLTTGKYLKLSFIDSGKGLDHETKLKIFDPFFTTKEADQGTGMGLGLGLAFIDGIMKSYGGAITVESDLGKGTSFFLYFPIIDKSITEDSDEVDIISKGKERILFVDDEEMYADMGKEMLSYLVPCQGRNVGLLRRDLARQQGTTSGA